MKYLEHKTDICIVGGGLAGTCAAVAAARHGMKVVLMQDRPMLGGNASSEIRMWVCGAYNHNADWRETGILEELTLENFYRNPQLNYQIWDTVIYEKAYCEENVTLLLNTTCQKVEMDGAKIKSVTGWQMTSETYHTVEAKYFIDCSGDSVLAPLTGAEYRLGREARDEFNESIEPETEDNHTMGLSCMFQIREYPYKTTFVPPSWAFKFPTDDDIPNRDHELGNNYWWIEVGGDRDSIHDTDALRHELLKISYGVWDHCKNYSGTEYDNWSLDWIGFLPGKRESRRYVGDYIINQNDVASAGHFDDVVTYGGWSMDDHFPEGFWFRGACPNIHYPAPTPWGIPWRALYSKNIENLLFAGRNISATHAAMSSSRVMATCALVGQTVGTGVAMSVKSGVHPRNVDIDALRGELMLDDCLIPYCARKVGEKTLSASTNAEVTRNGIDRQFGDEDNCWHGKEGDFIEYSFDGFVDVEKVRLIFDSNLRRKYHNMPSNYPLVEKLYKLPDSLIKEYRVEGETENGWETLFEDASNHQRLAYANIGKKVKKLRIIPLSTWGADEYRIFSVDII